MLLVPSPDIQQKIALLAREACFDVAGPDETGSLSRTNAKLDDLSAESDGSVPSNWGTPKRLAEGATGYLARRPGRGPLLKVLMSDSCHNNCLYCAFRAGADRRRTAFRPEELASAFLDMYGRGQAKGLFLSSGLAGNPRRMMEEMLSTAEILRRRYRYPGYLHLKILPGATDEYVEAACRLADRVSANLEAPNAERLASLCPEKQFDGDLLDPLRRVERFRRQELAVPLGQVTQFVVGAAGETDRELLSTTEKLYREIHLARAYFSAFQPLRGTPLEDRAPESLLRQHRLYQADTLIRQYGFALEELPLSQDGNLPRQRDPKLEWAEQHPERFPLEVNTAPRADLLRVPGIGPRTATAILNARRKSRLRSTNDLKALSVPLSRAAPYLLVAGRRCASDEPVQLVLWS